MDGLGDGTGWVEGVEEGMGRRKGMDGGVMKMGERMDGVGRE